MEAMRAKNPNPIIREIPATIRSINIISTIFVSVVLILRCLALLYFSAKMGIITYDSNEEVKPGFDTFMR